MTVYNLRFFSSIRTDSYITNGLWLKYLILKNIPIQIFVYRKKRFFCNIAKTRTFFLQNNNLFLMKFQNTIKDIYWKGLIIFRNLIKKVLFGKLKQKSRTCIRKLFYRIPKLQPEKINITEN